MSLLDALLLDPAPFEAFVAYRTDSIGGSGTINDPWNAATKLASPFQVTALTNSGFEATATAASHNFVNGDVVTIAGVTGAAAAQWNGTFSIYNVSGSQFQYYMTALPSAAATLGASTAAKVIGFRFDAVMAALPANSRVHLGPTPVGQPFLTRGYADGVGGAFQLKPGIRISGSGVDVTTVQLVGAASANSHYFAFGHALSIGAPAVPNGMDFVALAEMTIDCNLTPPSGAAIACGAVRVMGNQVRIRRVKAVNWGNRQSSNPGYVFALIMADPATGFTAVDAGIDDCVVQSPATSTTGEVLILHVGGKDFDTNNQLEAYGSSAFIRNCFVDCDSNANLGDGTDYRAKFRGLSMNSCKGGLVEGNQIHNTWYGGPYLTKWTAPEIIVRNNFYKNVVSAVYLSLPAAGTGISITQFSLPGSPDPPATVQATVTAHPLSIGDRVKITNGLDPLLNGIFVVTGTTPTTFKYVASAVPNPAGTGTLQKVLGLEKLVVEFNTVELAPFKSGSVTPVAIQLIADSSAAQPLAYVYGDVIIRGNRVRYLNAQFDSGFFGYALNVKGARDLMVRDNVVESAVQMPFQNSLCGSVNYFNDQTPAGTLVQGVNNDLSNKKYDELATIVEDAFVLAYLNER